MNDAASSGNSRIIRPTGALFQADMFLGEWLGAEGFTKQITLWKVRPELCGERAAVAALRWDLNLAGQLSTAQVTHVLDVWYTEEAITVVVEHLAGVSLADLYRQAAENGTAVPEEVILSAAFEAARALEATHDPQSPGGIVVHGDLRPENILLGYEGTVKLTGYGFASFLPAASRDGSFCVWDGWCYQPPERYEIPDLDPRSDIFSLGVVLLEALARVHPWSTQDPDLLREMLRSGGSPIPEEGVELPADVAEVVRRACALDPSQRYQTASELAEELHGLLYTRGRTSTTAVLRGYLGEYLDDDPDFDLDEEDPTVTSLSEPADRARLLEMSRQIPTYRPKLRTPEYSLVGRTDVLRTVSQALVGSSRGEGMAILLVGAPGMGRTRLLSEVAVRLSSSEQKRAWLHVKSRPAERAVRFSSVLRLLAVPAGLEPDCELYQVGQRAERLKALGLDEQMLDVIRAVSIQEEPEEDPCRTSGLMSRALISCISSVAHEQTTILAWDDLQWADDGSVTCLSELMAELPVLPVMALLSATPEFRPPWPPDAYGVATLVPLSRDECEDLILELVRDAARVSPPLLDAVLEQTGGNPLQIEEVINLLLESGRVEIKSLYLELMGDPDAPLPSFEGVIRDRLAQMDEQALKVALAAALAGPALREDVLVAATEMDPVEVRETLERLAADTNIFRQGSRGFGFVHERKRRALLNAAPAEALDALFEPVARAILDCTAATDGLDEVAASLLIRAGDPATAAEILFDTAEAQEEIGDAEGALQRFKWALELARSAGTLGQSFEMHLCLGIGRTAFGALRFDQSEAYLMEAIELSEACSDWATGAEAEILLLQLFARQGRLLEAMERAKDAIPLAESTGDPLLLAQAYGAIGEAYQQCGQYGPDLRYIEAAVSFASESDDNLQIGRFLQLAVTHAAGMGEFEQTQLLLEQAKPLAEENRDSWLRGELLKAETMLATFSGDAQRAVNLALQGVELAHCQGLHELEVVMLNAAGEGNLRLDRPREALYYFSESLRRSRAARYDRLSELSEMHIGYIEAVHLNQTAGLIRIREALKRAEDQSRIWNLYQGHLLLGRALRDSRPEEAAQSLERALESARQSGIRFFIDEAQRWIGKLSG